VPLFALTGIEGRLFVPLGIAYIVAILGSLVTAITLTPVLAYYFLSGPTRHRGDSFDVRLLKRGNTRLLDWAFDHQRRLFAVLGVAIVAAGVGANLLPRAFLPAFNEGTLLVSLQYNPGISLAESNRLGTIAERIVMAVPEVKSVGRRTGRAELDEHAEGVHTTEIDIDLAPSARTKEQVFQDIRTRLGILPVAISIGQPIAHRIDHMLSGIQAQIVI
jgi:HME family heavy-metal exporter